MIDAPTNYIIHAHQVPFPPTIQTGTPHRRILSTKLMTPFAQRVIVKTTKYPRISTWYCSLYISIYENLCRMCQALSIHAKPVIARRKSSNYPTSTSARSYEKYHLRTCGNRQPVHARSEKKKVCSNQWHAQTKGETTGGERSLL